jgi:hypothetical protein
LRIRKRCIRPTHDIRSERALNLLHWNAITNCIRALRKKKPCPYIFTKIISLQLFRCSMAFLYFNRSLGTG